MIAILSSKSNSPRRTMPHRAEIPRLDVAQSRSRTRYLLAAPNCLGWPTTIRNRVSQSLKLAKEPHTLCVSQALSLIPFLCEQSELLSADFVIIWGILIGCDYSTFGPVSSSSGVRSKFCSTERVTLMMSIKLRAFID